ncbi:MAG: hypothetical protein JWO99_695 [Candidatus Saccharibacteria bacterium]|nr:hypothetical protein [Candidatus Saccharibacteria bacterium]
MYEAMPKEGTSLDSAIREMDTLSEVPDNKALAEKVKQSLGDVKSKLESGIIDADTACAFLFDLYVKLQGEISETEIGHIVRVVGDDLGYQLGVDDDKLWDMYQQSLDRQR